MKAILITTFLFLSAALRAQWLGNYAASDTVSLTWTCVDSTVALEPASADTAMVLRFRQPAGAGPVLVDSIVYHSGTTPNLASLQRGVGHYLFRVKASDGSENLGIYMAEVRGWNYLNSKRIYGLFRTYSWSCGGTYNEVRIVSSDTAGNLVTNLDKQGYRLSSAGIDDIWDESQSGHTIAGSFGKRLDEDISAIDDNPWDDFSRTLTDTSNIGASIAADASEKTFNIFGWGYYTSPDTIARYVWSYSDPITLTDTVPKVYAVNAGGSDPDTVASRVWTWADRTLTSGVGTGSNQVTITVRQLADSTVLNGVQVQVLNQAQTATEGLLRSNSLGQAVFAFNDGTYKVRLFKPGYVFTVPESVIVSGNIQATFYGSAFDPGNPPSASLCRVYGYVKDINNLPAAGAKIEALIKTVPLRFQSVIISPYYKSTVADNNGYWYLDLFPNQLLTPSDTKYRFNIQVPSGSVLRLESMVPDQSSWELSF
jgi:hypothetical protein